MKKEREAIINSHRTMEIINYLYINPESSSIKIIRELRLNIATVSNIIRKLKDCNLITWNNIKKSREIPLSLNQEGMEIGKLINQLMFKLKE